MTPDTVVVDLDGTLSDGRARYHLVRGKHRDYAAFHARLGEDPVNEWCKKLIWQMRSDEDGHYLTRVVLVSARPKSVIKDTGEWLEKHNIYVDEIYLLREDGDSTPDHELKREWLHMYGKSRILFVVDDRQKVVDMWREEGVVCLQCAAWEDDRAKK